MTGIFSSENTNKIFPKLDELFSEDFEMEGFITDKNMDDERMKLFDGFKQPKSLSKEDLFLYGYRFDDDLKFCNVTPDAHESNEYFYIMQGNTEDIVNPKNTPHLQMVQEIKL